MPRPRALPLATLCLCLCLATPGPAAPLPPGDHARTLRHRSQDRSFLLHVPPQAAAGRPLPLVVGLHGGGGSHATFAAKTGFSALADREGFLVAYPDGSGRLFRDCAPGGHVMALVATQGTHAWWGTRGRASRRDGARDLDATALVWDFVSRHRRPPPGGGF